MKDVKEKLLKIFGIIIIIIVVFYLVLFLTR